jgi:hypothetical protein
MYVYIGFKTFFYIVRHLDSTLLCYEHECSACAVNTRRLRTASVGSALKIGGLILPEKETLLLWYLKVYLNIVTASQLLNHTSLICDKSVRNSKFGIFELSV